jgi:hypothetical protein
VALLSITASDTQQRGVLGGQHPLFRAVVVADMLRKLYIGHMPYISSYDARPTPVSDLKSVNKFNPEDRREDYSYRLNHNTNTQHTRCT